MNRADHDLLAVGRIDKAFGIRGEVIVSLMTDSSERFRALKQVLVGRSPAAAHPAIVEQVSVGPRGVRLKLAGIDTRDAAGAQVGAFLFVDARHRVRPANGRHFVHELVGLSVVDEQGCAVGTVRDVMKLPAHDVYVIDRAGREVLIPAVKEFIRSIDRDARTMTVRLIEGMLDEV